MYRKGAVVRLDHRPDWLASRSPLHGFVPGPGTLLPGATPASSSPCPFQSAKGSSSKLNSAGAFSLPAKVRRSRRHRSVPACPESCR